MDLDDLESIERLRRRDNPFPRPPQSHDLLTGEAVNRNLHEIRGEQRYPAITPREMVIMGPVPQKSAVFKCYIRHSDGRCTCEPPEIVSASMLETCNSSTMYLLGVLNKKPEIGKLKQEDLDFLAWSVSKMSAHWGRLALGQEGLS